MADDEGSDLVYEQREVADRSGLDFRELLAADIFNSRPRER